MTTKPDTVSNNPQSFARIVGGSLLAGMVVGVLGGLTMPQGIDINLSADVVATAKNMLDAEIALRAKAYAALLTFALEVVFAIGLYLLLRPTNQLFAAWATAVSLSAGLLALSGAVFDMNAAEIAGDIAYSTLANEDQRQLLTGLQATSDYTSFHLALVLSSAAKAGFFYLFWRSNLIPRLISGWGLFASLFVASMIVARDFIPALANNYVTVAFMLSNMIALVTTALYLSTKGVRTADS